MNFTTTMFGYNATYHCQDDTSEMYTTQCTSAGVWEPDPNALNCTDPNAQKCYMPGISVQVYQYNSYFVHTRAAHGFCPMTTVLRETTIITGLMYTEQNY